MKASWEPAVPTDLGHHAGLLYKLGTGDSAGIWLGVGCSVFSLSVLTIVSEIYRSRSKRENTYTCSSVG